MRVEIELKETSQPIIYENVSSTYTKGPFYCVYASGAVAKYPLDNIWRVYEDYCGGVAHSARIREPEARS